MQVVLLRREQHVLPLYCRGTRKVWNSGTILLPRSILEPTIGVFVFLDGGQTGSASVTLSFWQMENASSASLSALLATQNPPPSLAFPSHMFSPCLPLLLSCPSLHTEVNHSHNSKGPGHQEGKNQSISYCIWE